MKKYGLLMVLLVSGLHLFAQGKSDMRGSQEARMKAELSLTDEQVGRLKDINEKFRSEQAQLSSDSSITRVDAQEKRKKMIDEREASIRTMLTEEQFAKWTAMKATGRKDTRQAPGSGNRRNPMEEMKTAVGLSDDQFKKVMAINRDMAADFKKLRADASMTRENGEKAMKAIMEKRNAKIKLVLDDEQYTRFVAYEAERTRHRRMGEMHNPG